MLWGSLAQKGPSQGLMEAGCCRNLGQGWGQPSDPSCLEDMPCSTPLGPALDLCLEGLPSSTQYHPVVLPGGCSSPTFSLTPSLPWPPPPLFPTQTTLQPGLAHNLDFTPFVLLSLGFLICQMGYLGQDLGEKHIHQVPEKQQ